MEPTAIKLVTTLTVYGPLGVLAALGFVLFFLERRRTEGERKRSEELAHKLYEIGIENIKADMEHAKSYSQLEKTLDMALKIIPKKGHGYGD